MIRFQRILKSTYEAVLNEATNLKGMERMTIPAISCGIYEFPIKDAVDIALRTIFEFRGNPVNEPNSGIHPIEKWIKEIVFVVLNEEFKEIYKKAIAKIKQEYQAWDIFQNGIKGIIPSELIDVLYSGNKGKLSRQTLIQKRYKEQFEEIKSVLEQYPEFSTRFEDWAIKKAVLNNSPYNIDIVKLLLKFGSDIDTRIVEMPYAHVYSLKDIVKLKGNSNSDKMLQFLSENCSDVTQKELIDLPKSNKLDEIPAFLRESDDTSNKSARMKEFFYRILGVKK